jgi:hypothetical protein
MKIHPTALGILLVLIVAAFVYEYNKSSQLRSTRDAIAQDRDTMTAQIKHLERRINEAVSRESAPPAKPTQPTSSAERTTPPATSARVEPVATPGVSITAPAGWGKNGSNNDGYIVGVDQLQTWGGMPSAYVKSNGALAKDFGGMMQMASAENYVGKRVRLSGWVKTEDANDGGGHLWMRVDGQQRGVSLQFDNMDNRPVNGTNDWQEASVVLDVPAESSALAYGFFVKGSGKMWMSGTKIEEVGPDVPSTNVVKSPSVAAKSLPKTPVNLGFGPEPAK